MIGRLAPPEASDSGDRRKAPAVQTGSPGHAERRPGAMQRALDGGRVRAAAIVPRRHRAIRPLLGRGALEREERRIIE